MWVGESLRIRREDLQRPRRTISSRRSRSASLSGSTATSVRERVARRTSFRQGRKGAVDDRCVPCEAAIRTHDLAFCGDGSRHIKRLEAAG
jgi:hypothetical protein